MAFKMDQQDDVKISFGKSLTNILYDKQMTQRELAERLDVSQAAVSAWCKGQKLPKAERIDQICSILRIDRSELILPWDYEEIQNSKNNSRGFFLFEIENDQIIRAEHMSYEELDIARRITKLDEQKRRLVLSFLEFQEQKK